MIIDRSKSQQEIDTRIDQLDGEFQKAERSAEIPELVREGGQYSEGLGDVLTGNEKLDRAHSEMSEWGGEKRGTAKKEEERKSKAIGS